MLKIVLGAFFCISCCGFQVLTAQENTSGSDNLTLSPSDLGALQNSVNLYTGQVSFPMTIASLPGRGGLSPKVTINYNSSGLNDAVETWNRENPTGILGLGWSFDFPRIISNHNNTVTRQDDVFYLIEGGQSVRLICIDSDSDGTSGFRSYKTEIYQPWRVHYHYGSEKWEIIKDDGTRYVYGDNARPKNDGTLQNMVAWQNWIGSSNVVEGQSEMPYIWNLSEIENLWNDKITYYYENIEEEVGTHSTPGAPGNPKHTRASVLSRIEGPIGNYIQLNYSMKEYIDCPTSGDFRCTDTKREYQDLHEETSEPDAYQEKYESRYLQSIEAFDELGLPIYDVNFTYNEDEESVKWIGEGEFTKRLLTGIEQTNYTGVKLPKTSFAYETGDVPYKGYLIHVSNSIGGEINYQYEVSSQVVGQACLPLLGCTDIERSFLSEKDILAEAPDATWSEPNIYMGPDYVVVIWRQNAEFLFLGHLAHTSDPRPSYLQIYEWKGEWVKHDMGSLGNLRLSHDIEKQELVIGLEQDHFGIALRQGTNLYRMNLFHKNKYNGSWASYSDNVTLYDGRLADAQYLSELYLHSGRNHFSLGNMTSPFSYMYTWDGSDWEKNQLNYSVASPAGMHYTSSDNFVLAHNINTSPDEFSIHLISEDKVWTTSAFNANFRTDAVYSDQKREDRSYWYSTPSFLVALADDNPEYAYVLDQNYIDHERFTLPAVGDYYPVVTPSNTNINISAHPTGEFEDFNDLFFYRYDGDEWKQRIIKGEGLFDVYAGPKLYHSAPDIIGFSIGESTLGLMRYDANIGDWSTNQYTTPINWLDRYVKVSSRSALMGNKLYYLEPDGQWIEKGEVDTDGLNGSSWYEDLKSANDLYAFSKPYTSTMFYKFINGEIRNRKLSKNMDKRTSFYDVGDRLLSSNIMAAFDVDNAKKADTRKFHLYKWQRNDFNGGHANIVVSNVRVNDGILDINKAYGYNFGTARVDASGNVPLFNEVTVVTGSSSVSNHPKGYTKHYFHNGKPLADLPKLPVDQVDADVLLFAGSHYRTEMYNKDDVLLTESETIYSTEKQVVQNIAADKIDETYSVRPTLAVTKDYLPEGTQTAVTLTTYNEYGYPIEVENRTGSTLAETKARNAVQYTYYPESYDETEHNIYSEIIATKNLVNGTVVSASATVWDVIAARSQAIKTYSWRGFGSSVFQNWDGSEPAGQWRLGNKTEQRDNHGNILESSDFMGDYESAVYDDLMLNPV
ncbi:MAG: hypothetical protein AAF731_05935, partial [Bacteroidota bacterium]